MIGDREQSCPASGNLTLNARVWRARKNDLLYLTVEVSRKEKRFP